MLGIVFIFIQRTHMVAILRLFILFPFLLSAQAQPVELGKVQWLRNLDEAQKKARQEKKPILILFQEVPGCSTCQHYGQQVLSHPLIVEAVETYFIPLCIYNNLGDHDGAALKFFSEPSWNNPVVRIVDSGLKDMVLRVAGDYHLFGIVQAMRAALKKQHIEIPRYLEILKEEAFLQTASPKELYFQMYCFWSGESAFGIAEGILGTEAGFMNGNEVVRVSFNPNVISAEKIIQFAKDHHLADRFYAKDPSSFNRNLSVEKSGHFRRDPETKYYLYKSSYRIIPMTSLQSLRINHELATEGDPKSLLSPRQLAWYSKNASLNPKANLIGKDIIQSWYLP